MQTDLIMTLAIKEINNHLLYIVSFFASENSDLLDQN